LRIEAKCVTAASKVPSLARQLAGRRQDRPGHENRVTHLIVKRHDRQRLVVLAEDLIRCSSAKPHPALTILPLRSPGQFRENQMARLFGARFRDG